jgi:hypothetical protein
VELKALYLGIGILGVLLILSGGIFALQGAGKIGGSLMTGNPFWIYAGSGILVLGLILTVIGFVLGARMKAVGESQPKASAQASDERSEAESQRSSKP